MITNSQISNIGKLVKPHGVNGEIVVTIDCDIDLSTVKCIIINIDGINIPFFISSIRPRGKESYLIIIDGINNETDAAYFACLLFGVLADCVRNDKFSKKC